MTRRPVGSARWWVGLAVTVVVAVGLPAIGQIEFTGPWNSVLDPCVEEGDVVSCGLAFEGDGFAAHASAHAAVDQDWAPWGSDRSSVSTGLVFSRRFRVTEATRVSLSGRLAGRLLLEDTPGEASVLARAGIRDGNTGLDIAGLQLGEEGAAGTLEHRLLEEGEREIDDRVGERRIVWLEAGDYLVWGELRVGAWIDPGWWNDRAIAAFDDGFHVEVAAHEGSSAAEVDRVVVPLGAEGTSYAHLRPGTPGGTLYAVSISNPKKWNHVTAHETSTSQFTNIMLRGLTDIDPNNSAIVPELAKSWTVSEDGREIVFELRRGLQWSDGAPFTADDVVFTFNDLYFNDDIDTDTRDVLRLPDGSLPVVEKIDEVTVRVRLSAPFRPILTAMGAAILPKHVLADKVGRLNPELEAGAFNEAWGLDTDPSELVGMGPFIVERYRPDQYVIMRRNPFYYHYDPNGVQLPYLDRYFVHIVENQDASLLKFRNGELHVLGIRPSDVPVVKELADTLGIEVLVDPDVPDYGTSWISINQDIGLAEGTHERLRELYRDLRFRRALAHCIDKETIISNVYNGLAVPQWSPVSYMSPFYAGREVYGGPVTERDAVAYEFDLDAAASLLDEIGVVDRNGDGWRDYADGTTVEMEMNTGSSTDGEAMALIITEDLNRVGLKVAFAPREFNSLVTSIRASTSQLVLLGLSGGSEPNSGANVYGSCGGLHFWHYSGCEEPYETERRIDELLAAGVSTYDSEAAFEVYKEYQLLIAGDDLGLVYTVNPAFTYAYYRTVGNGNIANPVATPSGGNGLTMDLVFLVEEE